MPTKIKKKKILSSSFFQSFQVIKKNKLMILLMLIIEIIFLLSVSFISIHYIPKIVGPLEEIDQYISENQEDIMGDDPLSIYTDLESMFSNMKFMLFFIFIVYMVFSSISWLLTANMVTKIKDKLNYLGKFFIVSFIVLSMIFLFVYIILKPSAIITLSNYLILFLLSGILLYFMFICFALINTAPIKDIPKQAFSIGIKKAHYILLIYAALALIAVAFSFLTYILLEIETALGYIGFFLLFFTIVWGRLFFILAIDRLTQKV